MSAKKRILVVDDDVTSTRVLKLSLEGTNTYEVRVENCPEDALSSAQEFQPHLIILDVMMPRMFGGDVAAQMQADEQLKSTPIVFLTAAMGKTRVAEHGGIINGFPFLAKPVNLHDIVVCIESQLTKSAALF